MRAIIRRKGDSDKNKTTVSSKAAVLRNKLLRHPILIIFKAYSVFFISQAFKHSIFRVNYLTRFRCSTADDLGVARRTVMPACDKFSPLSKVSSPVSIFVT